LDDAKFESSEEYEAEEEEEPHTPVLRRSVRERRKLERYSPPDFHVPILLYLLLMMIPKLSGKQ
jgi:hypothetical protein